MGEVGHVIAFHVVTEGACWTEAVDRPGSPVRIGAGEMVIFPGGERQHHGVGPGHEGHARLGCVLPDPRRTLAPVDRGQRRRGADAGAERCRFVCGYLVCDTRPFNPLLAALPTMVSAPVSAESWQWVARLLDAAVEASGQDTAGRDAMLAKLAELMFVEALRGHIATAAGGRPQLGGRTPGPPGGRGTSPHPRRNRSAPWTLEQLAREVSMSRSAFAERFTAYVQVPPMQYLARWRLQLPRGCWRRAARPARSATAVGYQSEAAFHRAFKRLVGVPPGCLAPRSARET